MDSEAISPATISDGTNVNAKYGSEVSAGGPRQDMFAIDNLTGPLHDRDNPAAIFNGGSGGSGLGGQAEGQEPGVDVNGVQRGERIGI